jgi:glycosyltransferase involved in cell wall biosynthesis
MGPSLSVVIPSRNRASVIGRAVESVLRSPRPDIEVIVVDDGSTDNTAARLARIADTRLRIHRIESNGNANRARNIGARLSRGPLIAFLDSDDVFAVNRVGRLIEYFASHNDVDCLVDGYVEISRGRQRVHRVPRGAPSASRIRRALLAHLIPLTNSAITLRRTAFESVNGYDECMPRHQDRELLLRLGGDHSIGFDNKFDIEKHRGDKSLSHEMDGYIMGLDALAARHPDYFQPEYIDIFRYLIVRGIIKAFLTGHWFAAFRELRKWRDADHLPKDYIRCFVAYGRGQKLRRSEQTE